ncbi:MAG: flagellar basal body P-ring protein FlgI [Campylobacterota bacterium]|nr:flagellar basal body P-ring protein FlgI [Campylobacterota bacterium]
MKRLIFIIVTLGLSLYSQTIKDISNIVGIRENQLIGYGLIVGLNKTGDGGDTTKQSLQNLLRNSYIKVNIDQIKSKNIASVMVTAILPPFARQGDKIKVKVSSIGDAKSINGGELLLTQLKAVDGKVYALAQGSVISKAITPTNGYIYDGATVENELRYDLKDEKSITLSLLRQDATTAALCEAKINEELGENLAVAYDTRTIKVDKPNNISMISFISKIQNIELFSLMKKKIVIDPSKEMIVAGSDITIEPITISRKNFTLRIKKSDLGGRDIGDEVNIGKDIENINLDNALINTKKVPTVSDLMRAMKIMKININEIIETIKMLDKLGAINADVEIIR